MPTALQLTTLEPRFEDAAQLRGVFERELCQGGFFFRGPAELDERERCRLRLVHPETTERLELAAEVVWIAPDGFGLQILDFDEALKERLGAFVEGESAAAEAPAGPASANPYLRLRGLPLAEQLRRARTADMQERIALERLYGKAVWEVLLGNPRISVVEVARIARKGQLPMPLLDQIAANDAWIATAEVRRALLSSPRLRGRALRRVLGALPKSELALVEQQTAYPAHVRTEARRRRSRG